MKTNYVKKKEEQKSCNDVKVHANIGTVYLTPKENLCITLFFILIILTLTLIKYKYVNDIILKVGR